MIDVHSGFTGVALAVCTVSFGVTGYSLPYDQVGYWALRIVSGVPDCITVAFLGGPSVGQATLTLALMLVHFLLIRKQGISGTAKPTARMA
jgi:cytochrome b6